MQFKNDEASKIVKFGSADVSSYSSTKFKAPTGGYRMAMRDLLKAIRDYAVYRNHPDFGIIAYGGTSIFAADKSQGWTKEKYQQLKGVIDAVIVEAYYYGLNADWDDADDKASPQAIRDDLDKELKGAREIGANTWCVDYCSTETKVKDSQKKCESAGFQASFQASGRDLNYTPTIAMPGQSKAPCFDIRDAKNFVVLLDPNPETNPQFKSKEDYISQLVNCDADALLIDINYDKQILTTEDVYRLKFKSNGARRQVFCYFSVGEAESNRPYFDPKWKNPKPDWVGRVNEDFDDNYNVKYWTEPWRKVLIESDGSYADVIISLGFDGIFAANIDAYENFE